MLKLLPCVLLLTSGCFFTNYHSPRANKAGEVTGGIHVAGVIDTTSDDEDGPEGVGTIAGTVRVGTDFGEIGGALSAFSGEVSLKVPLTPQDGALHISLLGTIGSYLLIFPEATVGALAGHDFGPLTPYLGYRQHIFAGGFFVGHMIGGIELRVSEYLSFMVEGNYNTLFSGTLNEDEDGIAKTVFDAFDVPVFSIGINFGRTRSTEVDQLPPPTSGPPGAPGAY